MNMERRNVSRAAAWAVAFGCATGWGSFIMPGTMFLPTAGPLGTALGALVGGLRSNGSRTLDLVASEYP